MKRNSQKDSCLKSVSDLYACEVAVASAAQVATKALEDDNPLKTRSCFKLLVNTLATVSATIGVQRTKVNTAQSSIMIKAQKAIDVHNCQIEMIATGGNCSADRAHHHLLQEFAEKTKKT